MVLGVVVGAAAAFGIVYGVKALLANAPPGSGGFAFVGSDSGHRATIWAVGDGDASDGGRAVARRIGSAPFDRLLYLGDVYENGSAGDFARNYAPSYGRFAARTAPTPGNHDWPEHTSGYDPYWRRALHRRRAAAWYAFDAGGWRILSVDSEDSHGETSAQLRWLRSELRRPGTCRIAFWHRPRFSAGRHGDQGDMAPVWDALRGHAAIVLGGHDHDMQRMRAVDGITEFVSGAGGHGRYGVDRGDRRLAFADDRSYGALRLVLRPGRADYAFVAARGGVLDSGTLRCRR
jgi:hypothetical protein